MDHLKKSGYVELENGLRLAVRVRANGIPVIAFSFGEQMAVASGRKTPAACAGASWVLATVECRERDVLKMHHAMAHPGPQRMLATAERRDLDAASKLLVGNLASILQKCEACIRHKGIEAIYFTMNIRIAGVPGVLPLARDRE